MILLPNLNCNLTISKQSAHLVLNKQQNVDFNIIVQTPYSLNDNCYTNNDVDVYLHLSNIDHIPFDTVKQLSQLYFNKNDPRSLLFHGSFDVRIKAAYDTMMCILDDISKMDDKVLTYNIASSDYYNIYVRAEHGERIINNILSYGVADSDEWRLAKWGCKLNADNTLIHEDESDPDILFISFNTSWRPPTMWLKALSDRNVNFECTWSDESDIKGIYRSIDGEFTLDEFNANIDLTKGL